MFNHVTAEPVFTVRTGGSNAKFLIIIVFPPPDATVVAAGDAGAGLEEQPAAMQVMITSAEQVKLIIRRECADIYP